METEAFQGGKSALCGTVMVDPCLYKCLQTHRMHETDSEPKGERGTLGDDVNIVSSAAADVPSGGGR